MVQSGPRFVPRSTRPTSGERPTLSKQKSSLQSESWSASMSRLAVQTQPLLCGRCNALLSELVTNGAMAHAMEIQKMVGEGRQSPKVNSSSSSSRRPRHVVMSCIITFADQARVNRPGGDPTGSVIAMVLLSWRGWELERKAIGFQVVLEGEDVNFRVKLLWGELHGAASVMGRAASS